MTNNKFIVVLGSMNMDLVVLAERAPNGGETLPGKSFFTSPGGKGANQAVAISRLGGHVKIIGRVGNDFFGKEIVANLNQQGVCTNNVHYEEKTSTGVGLIVVEECGENRIIVVPGANEFVNHVEIEGTEEIIKNANLLVMQFEIDLKVVLSAAKMAKKNGVPVLLNPAPPYAISDELFQNVTYLILNEHEAEVVSGFKVEDKSTAELCARSLLLKGPKVVIITLGNKGVVMATDSRTCMLNAHQVKVVDSTAAGDTFIGAYSTALQAGDDIETALRFANAAAALAITKLGAQPSIPLLKEVLDFLDNEKNNLE